VYRSNIASTSQEVQRFLRNSSSYQSDYTTQDTHKYTLYN